MNKPEIIMYTRERYCPDVERSRARLTELDLTWTEYDIEQDGTAGDRVEAMTGVRRVPTIVLGNAVLVEPNDDELNAELEHAGYSVR